MASGRDHVLRHLRDLDAALLPFEEEKARGLRGADATAFLTVAAMALFKGVVRWPEHASGHVDAMG